MRMHNPNAQVRMQHGRDDAPALTLTAADGPHDRCGKLMWSSALVNIKLTTFRKTSLLTVFSKDHFPDVYMPTVSENCVADIEVDGKQVCCCSVKEMMVYDHYMRLILDFDGYFWYITWFWSWMMKLILDHHNYLHICLSSCELSKSDLESDGSFLDE
ncbi:unnamed protein product [Toxocara canis]|uniref:Phospholipid scramblase n=1 Tax=Toxocara canis TaxID=6265 RepID=A0A183VGM9_TOXCA|nr:unnamed protein product [Toxocara canis]